MQYQQMKQQTTCTTYSINVTRRAKILHILHFTHITISLEICIPICNCATVKNETKLVVWFPSYKVKCMKIVKNLGATLLHIHKSKV